MICFDTKEAFYIGHTLQYRQETCSYEKNVFGGLDLKLQLILLKLKLPEIKYTFENSHIK